jgi:hypothetical protein
MVDVNKIAKKILNTYEHRETPEHYKTELFKYMFNKGMVKTIKDLATICEKESELLKQNIKESIDEKHIEDVKKEILKLEKNNKILLETAKKVFDTGLV